jgi:hypothetical protein
MKKIASILLAVCGIGLAALFIACDQPNTPDVKTVTGIAITAYPDKTAYFLGEDLNLSGMVVKATFSDGSYAPVTGYTASGYDKTQEGSQTITVRYKEKTTTFIVTVIDPNKAATPTANPPAGKVANGTSVTLTTTTEGAEIWYTTNGNTPAKDGEGSTLYESPFAINPPVTIKAIAVKEGMKDSAILEAAYTIPVPSFIPSGTIIIPLNENIWADGNLTASIGEQWFKFTATADTQYIHSGFDTMSSTFGYHVQVYDSSGDKIGTESNLKGAAASADRYISRSVTPGQEYYIKVRRYSSTTNGNGTYQIAFNKSSTAPAITITLPSNATELTENIWADGNLTSSSGEQWFKFTATADTQYIHAAFGTLSPTMGFYVQVYDSSGAKVETEKNLDSSTKYISRSVTDGQEYYIKVRRYSSYNGTYQIAFNKSSTAPAVTVPLPSNAIELTEDTWADGNLSSSNPEQWFKFTATADTQYIHANFVTMNSTMGFYVQVYDSSGATVETEKNLDNSTKYISRSVTDGQEYYIKVRRYSSSYNGTYQIAFNKSSTSPAVTVTLPSNATELTENIWANGTLTSSNGEQWFKFTATANQQYIVAGFGTLNSAYGLYVQVYDSNGTAVGSRTNLFGSGISKLPINVTDGQVYYIKVWPYNTSYTGTYKIAFNSSYTASPLTLLNEYIWADGNLTSSSGEQWFKFTATANPQYIHVSFGTLSPTMGLRIQLYDSNNVAVGTEEYLHGINKFGINKDVSISVTAGQTYSIKVWPEDSSYTGTYKIVFNRSSTAPSITVTLPSNTNVITLTENQWADGNLASSSGEQWFRFTATESTQYIHANFGTMHTTSGMNVQVFNSSGVSVITDTNLCGTGSESFISINVTRFNQYYIRVWPNVLTGTYQIAYNASSTAPAITLPYSGVTQLTENTWADGNFTALDGKQWFKFNATADMQYIAFNTGTLTSVYAQVYDSKGVKVGNMILFPANNTYISQSVTSGQDYYIQVRPTVGTGTYKIGFTRTDPAP